MSVNPVSVPIDDAPGFDPLAAPEGWFATPKRLLLLFKSDKAKNPRLMCQSQLALMLFLENELWGERKEDKSSPKPKAGRRALLPTEMWTKPLTLLMIARACGVSVQAIQPVVQDAIERQLIARDQRRKGEREFRYRLCPENWANCIGHVSKPQDSENTQEAAEDDTSPLASTLSPDDTSPLASSRVKPGQSRTIEIAQTGQKFRARNRIEVEVEVSVTGAKDGLVEIDISVPVEMSGKLLGFPSRAAPDEPPLHAAHGPDDKLIEFLLPRFVAISKPLEPKILNRISAAIAKCGGDLDSYKRIVIERETRGGMKSGAYLQIAEQDLGAFTKQRAALEGKKTAAEQPDPEVLRRHERFETWCAERGVSTGPTGKEYLAALDRYERETGNKMS